MPTLDEAIAQRAAVLREEIFRLGEIEPEDVAQQGGAYGFGDSEVQVGGPMAGGEYACFAIFDEQDGDRSDFVAGDVRVYGFPLDESKPFLRVKLSRLPGAGWTKFYYTREAWIDAVADEFNAKLYEIDEDASPQTTVATTTIPATMEESGAP